MLSNRHFAYIHTRIVVTMRVLLAMESVTFVDESLLFSVKLRPVWEFHTPICTDEKIQINPTDWTSMIYNNLSQPHMIS